jgi:hypothetical protein
MRAFGGALSHVHAVRFMVLLAISTTIACGATRTSSALTQPKLDAMPPAIFKQMLSDGNKLVGSPGLALKARVVTVAFNGGSEPLYVLIEKAASEWTDSGGAMHFSFRDKNGRFRRWSEDDTMPAAAIRVGFYTDQERGGYWSAVGVMAANVAPNEPTLNLDGFPERLAPYLDGRNPTGWQDSYEHSVVLHEFGHALGLSHEHFHPQCQADLKLAAAITSLTQVEGWSQEQARFNMDAAYYFKVLGVQAGAKSRPVLSPTTDQSSVMLYSFSDDFYKSAAQSPCRPAGPRRYATSLSDGDRKFYLDTYSSIPKPF